MDVYKDILVHALTSKGNLKVALDNPNEVVECICYQTIQQIRGVLDNPELTDFECIEKIVTLLEGIGSDGGSRHDFG